MNNRILIAKVQYFFEHALYLHKQESLKNNLYFSVLSFPFTTKFTTLGILTKLFNIATAGSTSITNQVHPYRHYKIYP